MILDKLIIHLKNVLFFKAVIYILMIVGLVSLNPIVREELRGASAKREKARVFLAQAKLKLDSIQDFENKIVDINTKYQDLAMINGEQGCRYRNQFFTRMHNFVNMKSNKHNFRNLKVDMTEIDRMGVDSREVSNIHIKHYNGEITLMTKDYIEFSKFMEYLTSNLPMGAIITKCEVINKRTLTPDMIELLSEKKKPLLFHVRVDVLFREINYDR